MATYYNAETFPNNTTTNGIKLSASGAVQTAIYNVAELSGTSLSATFANTGNITGVEGLSSGTGKMEIDGAYKGATIALTMNDRTTFTFVVPNSAAATTTVVPLVADGYENVGRTFVRLRNQGQI